VFDHVTIRASDRKASERFYDVVLPVVGLEKSYSDEHFAEWDDFSLAQATLQSPPTKRLHIAFFAHSHDVVDEFWRTGTDAGFRDDGSPGPRPEYSDDYYGAFLLDPDGNSVEAVTHGRVKPNGAIDHVWIRVGDLPAAKTFYETIAPHAGLRLAHENADRVAFAGESGVFSLVRGAPTEHLHWAFPADRNATVDAFHRDAIAAGYRDNGEPGERPVYHAGYYGAFVLDPDGNNVEVVNHNR
jgi:catechol 2,3-dioxygenase-like lactoylglutathione lyase family enzyme